MMDLREINKGETPVTETVCALGLFDGVHRGHRLVIDTAVGLAKQKELRSAVFTFRTDTVTSKGHDGRIEMILTDEAKLEHFRRLGVDCLYSPDFCEMKDMSGEEFVKEVLLDRLRCTAVVCGSDFRFGRGAKDDSNSLAFYGQKYGFEVHICGKLTYEGEEVSSTVIREYIRTGHIDKANRLLGYTFGFSLEVEHGRELGRKLDFPTINQTVPQGQILPKFGVYASRVTIGGDEYHGVTNVGVKPTLRSHDVPQAETYILGFSGDLYGRRIDIKLDSFIRPEIGFDSIDELKAQIAKDTRTVTDLYSKR